jgi:ATP-binding cassette, subfamily B, bacterial
MTSLPQHGPELGRAPQLLLGEVTRAEFHPDLDASLRFRESRVLLTTHHLRYQDPEGRERQWPLAADLELRRHEHLGLNELELVRGEERLACFRFTLARTGAATALLDAWHQQEDDPPSSPGAEDDEVETPRAATSRFPLLRLIAFARPELGLVIVGGVLTLATTATSLIPPYLTMPLVDEVLAPAAGPLPFDVAARKVAFYLAGLGGAAVVAWILGWAQGALLARVSERVSADLRVRAFAHLQRLSLRYFGGKRTGDLIARISSDTDHLCSFLSDTLIDFVTDVLMIIGTAVVLFTLDPLLAIAALGSFPLLAILIVRVRSRLATGFLRGGRVWSTMTSILADTIPGIRVVKAFSQERREVERFRAANQRIVDVNNRVNALWTFFWPLVTLLNQIGLLVVWAVGAWQVLQGRVTIGVLTAFVAYISRFYVRVESMSRMLTATQRAAAAAQRLFEILDREPELMEPKDPVELRTLRGELRFDQVSFRYGTRLVLSGVSFTVAPGQMVGIVGQTGSGKSTVANLICRFYDPAAGAVLVDGVDVRRLPLEAYRKHIGIVLQDPFLFFGTIAENVSYGDPSAELGRMLAATRAARAHDFVLRLPEGYDSLVGERGQSLSGGERQRLAIARAIFVDPEILILDEATSAVDVQTEREIQRALDNVVQGRTTIAIAHRLSTLEKADLLVVLKHGKVVEIGSPRDLKNADGEYARMVKAQAPTTPAELLPAPSDEVEVKALLDAHSLTLRFDEHGQLWARDARSAELRVWPRRCFPLTQPTQFVSLVDAHQHEIACIAALDALTPSARAALESAFKAQEFLPHIERIVSIELRAAKTTWQVHTDRGPCSFVVEQEDHVRRLDDGRYLVTDTDGMRYLLRKRSELDSVSRRLLSRVA